jgi:tricorn protease
MGRFMRYPDIHKDKIVFVYGEDLWLVDSNYGTARRLTSHPGVETCPKFSPDGRYIAFSGEYDGNMDIYVIPSEGGEPMRLTYHPERDICTDWHPNGKLVLFYSSRKAHTAQFPKFFLIPVDGEYPEELPIPNGAGAASFSPDGEKIIYTRGIAPGNWKGYKGGAAPEVWLYDLKNDTSWQLTDWEGLDVCPIWYKERIYFVSDRDGTMNIYQYDLNTKEIRKLTDHTGYDVKHPSLGPNSIVYENGGFIYVFDLTAEETRKVPVEIIDDVILTRPKNEKVSNLIENYSLSPTAKRALFCARGEIFTVPKEKGNIRNVTNTPGIRERCPVWSPDGKWIAYLSDRTGEYELYIKPQDGRDKEIQITSDGDCYRFDIVWSPDSKKLLYSDSKLRVFYVDMERKKPVLIDTSSIIEIKDYTWSPNSRWIAYTNYDENLVSSIYLYSIDDKKSYRVTDDFYDDTEPAFDPEGRYLYFISSRSFNPIMGFEQRNIYGNMDDIYLVTLKRDIPTPFPPESDEEKPKEEKKGKEKEGKKEVGVEIDIEGISQRIIAVPIPTGNYYGLKAEKNKIFYLSIPTLPQKSLREGSKFDLHMYDINKREDYTLLRGIDSYDISYDGENIIYKSKDTYGIIEATSGDHSVGVGKLNTNELEIKVDPRKEWRQIFNEAWRLERDFFYDPNMHGIDWNEMKGKYGEMIPHINHRTALNYVIGEMIGEIRCSHAYIRGGDIRKAKKVKVGLLGADLEPDKRSKFYRFKKIFKGENWSPDEDRHSPLTQPGVDVKESEYLISINGRKIKYPDNPYIYLENTVGKEVVIEVNSRPTLKGVRKLTVIPISSEGTIRYIDWVNANRERVEEATDGRVGYIHVPNTQVSGLEEFSKAFFPQRRKEGLIIDVRYNHGGMVPEMFIERLNRKIINFISIRGGQDFCVPQIVPYGYMVCIINEFAGSGGDAFPYYFREYNLGPLIGKRTIGALVGIRYSFKLIDGGDITCPSIGFWTPEDKWIVENYGVEPDIEVDNLPHLVAKGRDPQLEEAIEVILQKIKKEPKKLPKRPPYPVKRTQ